MSTLEQRAAEWRRQSCKSVFSRLPIIVATVLHLAAEWRRRDRTRAELARMSDRDMRDIGITRTEVAHEVAKPFWRA